MLASLHDHSSGFNDLLNDYLNKFSTRVVSKLLEKGAARLQLDGGEGYDDIAEMFKYAAMCYFPSAYAKAESAGAERLSQLIEFLAPKGILACAAKLHLVAQAQGCELRSSNARIIFRNLSLIEARDRHDWSGSLFELRSKPGTSASPKELADFNFNVYIPGQKVSLRSTIQCKVVQRYYR